MTIDKKLFIFAVIIFVFHKELFGIIEIYTNNDGIRKGSGWGKSNRFSFSSSSSSGKDVNENSINKVNSVLFEGFIKEWNSFYEIYLKNEANNRYYEGVMNNLFMIFVVLLIIDVVLGSLLVHKILEKYVFIQRPFNNAEGYFHNFFTLRRSFSLRLRAWKLQIVRYMSLSSKRSKVFLAETHEDEHRKVYAYSIPLDMAPRIKVQWKEIGCDPSTMETKMIISADTLPISVFTSSSRIGTMIFGDSMNETDVFGDSIPLVEIPIDKNTVDPGDVVTFWETEPNQLPNDQDDKLLYIRIPKHGQRVTNIPILNGDPSEASN